MKLLRFMVSKTLAVLLAGAAMKTNAVIVGLVLGLAALVSGCTQVIQSGLPDPELSARDKQMMALAEPDEWKIPTVAQQGSVYSTQEKPGAIIVNTGTNYLYYVLPHGEAIEYRIAERRRIYGLTAAQRSER